MENMLQVMDAELYYADPCESGPSLSQSTAHTLLSRSPYHAWLEHPKLGMQAREASKAMDEGTILHSMILGTESSIEWLDYPDYRTKAAQLDRDSSVLRGMIPMLIKDRERLDECVVKVSKQLSDMGVVLNGQSEGVVLWDEKDNKNRTVRCKARIDHFDWLIIDDLKSTADAHPQSCVRRIIDGGYDMQAAVYLDAIAKKFPDYAGRLKFRNIFFETKPPYLVSIIHPGESMLELGRMKWARAVNIWSECLHENHWPAYGHVTVDAPAWAVSKEQEAEKFQLEGVW